MDLLQQLDLPSVSDSSDTDDFLHELAALNDVGLLRATMESLECGRLTPLIKEELRCRIQSRRLSEGKEELFVEFPSPTPSQPRPDEVEKRDRRREQNRRAAQKFRKKKKERGEHLIEETQRLECHNTTLRSEIKQLHEEREQLTRIIQNHASICPLTPRQSPLTITRESPLTPRQSPLTITRESPLSHSVRESPLPLTSFTGNIMASSPVMGKSPVLVQSPAILVPPTRQSPVPLLIINPARESPVPTPRIPSSPVPMSGRPRKSPVSLLRFNQSPIPGDKSPIAFGSPPKQSKHCIPAKLNLAGPKPVVHILPKPAPTSLHNSPSPKTPKTIITSPLPIAPSPGLLGRSLHVSPIFFREGCFTPSGHSRQISQSPVSVSDSSSSNSTPARITQQSPVFFVDRAPSSAHQTSHFLQPLSTSAMSSTPSLVTLLRQESPLSLLSNSSAISSASSVFTSNTSSLGVSASSLADQHTLANQQHSCVSRHLPRSSNISQHGPAPYSCPSHCSVRGAAEDNVLSLEEIEKSAAGFEARDDLIDIMDIQALLELSTDHTAGHMATDCSQRSRPDLGCIHQSDSPTESRARGHEEQDRPGCDGDHNVALLRAHGGEHCQHNTELSSAQSRSQDVCVSLLTQNLNKLPGFVINQAAKTTDNCTTLRHDGCSFDADLPRCHSSSAFRELGTGHFQSPFESPKKPAFRDQPATLGTSVLQTFRDQPATLGTSVLQTFRDQPATLGTSVLQTFRDQPATSDTSVLQTFRDQPATLGTSVLQTFRDQPATLGTSVLQTFRDQPATLDTSVLQTFRESQARKSLTVDTLQQLHNQLSELIRRERLTESSNIQVSLSVDDLTQFSSVRDRHQGRNLVDDNCFLTATDDLPNGHGDGCESDLINLHSSLPLDVLMASPSAGVDNVFSQNNHP